MRTFIRLGKLLATNEDIKRKIEKLEKEHKDYDEKFKMVFEAIKQMLKIETEPKAEIGFKA